MYQSSRGCAARGSRAPVAAHGTGRRAPDRLRTHGFGRLPVDDQTADIADVVDAYLFNAAHLFELPQGIRIAVLIDRAHLEKSLFAER